MTSYPEDLWSNLQICNFSCKTHEALPSAWIRAIELGKERS